MPIASAMTDIHRNCLVLTRNAHSTEILLHMSRGQIISAET